MVKAVDPVNDADPTVRSFVDTECTCVASVLGRSLKNWGSENMSKVRDG